ncbi:general secretion pathway protein GspD [uncultured Winogradskyella sp.]|uniref:type II secretion system protein GspD n=1 Tax=uncultured Winogradskyella sp. TaxID=395353 RepID=UPI00262E85D7|nr:general secretion pathway protein GspD [uncultured Winogradskyella sp.]
MKLLLKLLLIILFTACGYAQNNQRLSVIENQIELISSENKGFSEYIDATIALNDVSLPNFLLAVSDIHKVNINISPELSTIKIKNNFSNVIVSDMLLFLCKEYSLTIEFTKNILSIKPYEEIMVPDVYPIQIDYNPTNEIVSIDINKSRLYDVFIEIMDKTAKNLLYAPGMENLELTAYIKPTNFDNAMDKMALTNNLVLTKTKDNFYVFDKVISNKSNEQNNRLSNRLNSNLNFIVIDSINQQLEVNFKNTSIKKIVTDIGNALDVNMFMASPLDNAGNVTIKTDSISFDDLLIKIFEPQDSNTSNHTTTSNHNQRTSKNAIIDKYTFKKEDNIYFFGTEKQLSVRKVEIITLEHRSVNMMADSNLTSAGNDMVNNYQTAAQTYSNNNAFNNNNLGSNNYNNQRQTNSSSYDRSESSKTIMDLVPQEIIGNIDFKIDVELNSIYATGTGTEIELFKKFIKSIDKAIPVILIEVMIVEAQTSNTIEAGVAWGLGNEPTTTQGNLFPSTDLTLGSETINNIISGFSSASVFNFGKVVPNFFATVKAMETNGDLKIKSTPKLATLNGHRASFSNGQTSYYAIVQTNTIGSDNPLTTETRNYFPIEAKLGLEIKPFVTGNKEVILNINVIQSNFGQRIAEDAPPDINSRDFSSVVRMKDQDIAVLGGLEENYTSNSGSGVPFLARIPIIKWLFSQRVREGSKSKLTVFIKPTVIY